MVDKVPERAIKVHYEFDEVFFEYAASHPYTKAYELAEKEHERFFNRRRYSSYDSFRLRKKKKKGNKPTY